MPFKDYVPKVRDFIRRKWQQRWDDNFINRGNKLYEIMPSIKAFETFNLSRKDEVIIHRIRIGHTRLTHRYLMEDPLKRQPVCNFCYLDDLTIKHIFVDCLHFHNIRRHFFRVPDMRCLFEQVPLRTIIAFLKSANLYDQI